MTINNEYEKAVQHVLDYGVHKSDRTGTGTKSVFGYQMRFNAEDGFPLITTKKVHMKSIIHELLWFLKGTGDTTYLKEHNVKIWDAWRQPYNLDREVDFVEPRPPVYNTVTPSNVVDEDAYPEGSVEQKLVTEWNRMNRAVRQSSTTTVHPRWLDVNNFIEDAQKLPHWNYKEKTWDNFVLSSSYYGADQFGPETSVWVISHEAWLYTNDVSSFSGITAHNMAKFAERLTAVPKVSNGSLTVSYDIPAGKLMRLKLIHANDLGPVYGVMWREWPNRYGKPIDQIAEVIEQIKTNPDSRRLLVAAWNPAELPNQALPPCHSWFQFYVANGKLSLQLYQRSGDIFLGIPFNIASYTLLLHMVAQQTNLQVGEFIHTIGDLHLYDNHQEQVTEQLSREVRPFPTLKLRKAASIDEYVYDDFVIEGYDPHPPIKGAVAV
jgi:thymidylate synthase